MPEDKEVQTVSAKEIKETGFSYYVWCQKLKTLERPETLPDKLRCSMTGLGFGSDYMLELVREYNQLSKENPRKFEIAQEILSDITYATLFE